MSNNTKERTSSTPKDRLDQQSFNGMAIARIKSLLENPDISKSQKKTLLNILRNLEHQG